MATWVALHRASGLLPLGAYVLFHVWEHWPARLGRDPLFARLAQSSWPLAELLLLLLPLLVHAAVGLLLAARARGAGPYASLGFRRLQAASGVASGLFLGYHLATVWVPRLLVASGPAWFEDAGSAAAYAAILDQTGSVRGVAIHVLGCAAVCTHLGQGLTLALGRHLPSVRLARTLGALVGVLLWLALVDVIASYAAYAPLL